MMISFNNIFLSVLLILENITWGKVRSYFFTYRKNLYFKFTQKISGAPTIIPIREIHHTYLSMETLKNLPSNEPVVFRGLSLKTRAFQSWSIEYLMENFADIKMPFWGSSQQKTDEIYTLSFKEGMQDILNNQKKYVLYGGENDLINQRPELAKDIELEKIAEKKFWDYKLNKIFKIFISGDGNQSPPHSELGHILNFQFVGKKKWIILSPADTNKLFPSAENTVYLGTKKFNTTDEILNSKLNLNIFEVILSPGDVLYLPPYYWHSVESIGNSISVAFKWGEFSMLLKNPIITTYMFTCRKPNIFQIIFNRKKQKAKSNL